MKIKKFLAGGLAAVFAGGLALAGASADLGDYVTTTGGDTLASPMIVVGPQGGADVLGAADIAAAVAGYASTTTSCSGVGVTSVTGGVALDTASGKLYYGDALNTTKSTITSSDLPTILASGTFQDDDGTEYKYDQYIILGSRTIAYGNSGGDIEDPTGYIDIGTTATSFAYTTKVVFNKPIAPVTSEAQGNPIEFFGKEYTITSGSSQTKFVLFDSSTAQTFTEGESQTITVNSEEWTITLEGVSSTTQGVIQVTNAAGISKSKEINEGSSYKVNGLDVVAEDIFYFGSEKINKASLSFGSGKYTLETGNEVKVGSELDPIDNTLVTITGNVSTLEVAVAATDTDYDHAAKGDSFTDTVWGSFKLAFGGFTPALDATSTREGIYVDTSGDRTATLKMTDYRGNEKTVEFAWDTNSASDTFAAALNTSQNYQIHVKEAEAAIEKDYVVLSQGEFGHLFQISDISNVGSSTGKVDIKDVFSGETITINLLGAGYTNATAYIDGNEYYVNATATTVKFSWGAGKAYGGAGTQTSLYPFIKGYKGEDIALLTKTQLDAGVVYLPGGNTVTGSTQGTTAVTLANASAIATGTGGTVNTTHAAGQLYWNVTWSWAGGAATPVATIYGVGSASSWTYFGSHLNDTNTYIPAVLVLEEKGKDTSNSEIRDGIVIPTTTTGSGTVKMAINTPVMTAGTQTSQAWSSDTDKTSYFDRYGTIAVKDSSDQVTVDIMYPDTQAIASAAIGPNPTFGGEEGEEGTVLTAIKIKNPVAKYTTEINTASLSADIILVGGPCANTLVATLAADNADIPECDAWDKTKGIIKEVTNAFDSGQKALVVAGSSADDTRDLAAMVMKGTLDYDN